MLLASAILVAGLAVRVGFVEHTRFTAVNDAGTYNRLASNIAQTGDYDTGGGGPGTGAGGSRGPTAYFPPGFPYFLAVADLVDGHAAGHRAALHGERIEQALAGTAAVGLLGLVALELLGPAAALVAMALAAGYPVLIEQTGTLVAENLLVVLELAAVWTALRARRSDGRAMYRWIAATGALTGLATLTHQNAILLVLPLGAAMWSAGTRARSVALLVVTTLLAIAPWTIRNAVELHRFVPISDETGITLVGTYNRYSAAEREIPYKWRFFWKIPSDAHLVKTAGHYTEPQLDARLRSQALDYVTSHPGAPLSAGWHNLVRMLELEGAPAWHASAEAVGLHTDVAQTGVIAFWVMAALAVAGAFTRRARWVPGWIWAIPVLLALSVVLVNVETPRFREPIEPFLVLLAACAVTAAGQRLSVLGGAPVRRRRGPPELPGHAQAVQMIQRLAGADGHAGQGRLGAVHGHPGLQGDEIVEAADQRAPAGEQDPVASDVGRQLGGGLLQRVADRLQDLAQRPGDRRPHLL
jgi:4-amino-4-deoxy-L-arabinose transferase-like glycosyltransferase